MFDISREGRGRGNEQERRLEAMHVGLTEFLQKCEPAHLSTTRHVNYFFITTLKLNSNDCLLKQI